MEEKKDSVDIKSDDSVTLKSDEGSNETPKSPGSSEESASESKPADASGSPGVPSDVGSDAPRPGAETAAPETATAASEAGEPLALPAATGTSVPADDVAPTTGNVIEHADGRVELRDESLISSSNLYNHDLAPVPIAKRNWTTYNYAALWTGMCACIPTYMLSSGMIAGGMCWWQAMGTILLGNLIVLIPILLNSHPGTKYGIPFPVFARAAYGTYGSNLPALMRAVVACGWFGIQCWLGGRAVFFCFASTIQSFPTCLGPKVMGFWPTEWLSFMLFWALNVLIVYRGMDLLKKVEGFAAPYILAMCAILVVWAVTSAHGLGVLVERPPAFNRIETFLPIFIPSLTSIVGFWATLSLNMPDFTRYGRSQREQIIGQAVALPLAMTVLSGVGVIVTSAAMSIYPHRSVQQLWDPVSLISCFDNKFIVFIAMASVAFATLCMNIAANVVSPANDFSNALPKWINFRTGGLITAVIGIAIQPWKLISDPHHFMIGWLVAYSGGLGSIAGVLIVDYWMLKKRRLNLPDLYLNQGAYRYTMGWNFAAVAATLIGCTAAWGGVLVPQLRFLFDFGWFVGFLCSSISYMIFMPVPKKEVA